MKKYILLLQCCICFSSIVLSQNVSIGTITPQAKLHIKGTFAVVRVFTNYNASVIQICKNKFNKQAEAIG